jgi:hypothetical protein
MSVLHMLSTVIVLPLPASQDPQEAQTARTQRHDDDMFRHVCAMNSVAIVI